MFIVSNFKTFTSFSNVTFITATCWFICTKKNTEISGDFISDGPLSRDTLESIPSVWFFYVDLCIYLFIYVYIICNNKCKYMYICLMQEKTRVHLDFGHGVAKTRACELERYKNLKRIKNGSTCTRFRNSVFAYRFSFRNDWLWYCFMNKRRCAYAKCVLVRLRIV